MPPRAVFHHADVTDYQSVVNLFDKAFETFKRIDHVVAAVVATASIFDHGDSFDHALTLRTVREVSTLLYLAYMRVANRSTCSYVPGSPLQSSRCQPPWIPLRHTNRKRLPSPQPRRRQRQKHPPPRPWLHSIRPSQTRRRGNHAFAALLLRLAIPP